MRGQRAARHRVRHVLRTHTFCPPAVARMKEQVYEGDLERRRLHNLVQELKGNIRVFVRVRPFLPGDAEKALVAATAVDEEEANAIDDGLVLAPAITTAADGSSLEITPPLPRGTKEGPARREQKPLPFSFDTVFGQRTTQEDVFNEVSFLVQSALDGYNVCLFSYGQTGSGKTFTMQGGAGDAAGLIPRSVKQILDTAARMSEQGWRFELEVAFLEVRPPPPPFMQFTQCKPLLATRADHACACRSTTKPCVTCYACQKQAASPGMTRLWPFTKTANTSTCLVSRAWPCMTRSPLMLCWRAPKNAAPLLPPA